MPASLLCVPVRQNMTAFLWGHIWFVLNSIPPSPFEWILLKICPEENAHPTGSSSGTGKLSTQKTGSPSNTMHKTPPGTLYQTWSPENRVVRYEPHTSSPLLTMSQHCNRSFLCCLWNDWGKNLRVKQSPLQSLSAWNHTRVPGAKDGICCIIHRWRSGGQLASVPKKNFRI